MIAAIKNSLTILIMTGLFLPACGQHEQREGNYIRMEKEYNLLDLKDSLDDYLGQVNEFVAVSVQLTDQDLYVGIQDTTAVHAASTMKVPVMMEIFHQAELGLIDLDDSLLIRNSFKSIIDGSLYSLDIAEDGGDRLYHMIGEKESVRSLVREMITYSGNLATNLLIEFAGPENVQQLMTSLGANDIRILRGVEDLKAFQAGKNNMTTSRDLAILYLAIYQCKKWRQPYGKEMLDILLDQKFNEKIPAGLPEKVRVAHKTGSITGIDHDSGIIFPENRAPYILIVLTKGFADHRQAQNCIAHISTIVYHWYMEE